MTESEIIEKLKTINHLKLDVGDIPVDDIISEMGAVGEFAKFNTQTAHAISNKTEEIPENQWSVAYLKNFKGDWDRHDYWGPEEYDFIPNKDNVKTINYNGKDYETVWPDHIKEEDLWEYDIANFKFTAGNLTQFRNQMTKTSLGEKCPKTYNWFTETFGDNLRFGYSKLKAETGRVYKHSHFCFHKGQISLPYLYQVIHIPLITNPKSRFVVFNDWENDRYQDAKHYDPGEAWLFNSYKYHASINGGKDDRYHLLCFVWIPGNEKFQKLLTDAIEKNGY